jgi:acyl-homoserine-lactone acylase
MKRAFATFLVSCALSAAANAQPAGVQVRYTEYGVAHVSAPTMEGGGYGYGWAFARDNLCLFVERAITLAGERSKTLGPDAEYTDLFAGGSLKNVDSDAVWRLLLDESAVEGVRDFASSDVKALVRGYVAGFNRHVADAPLPGESCRSQPWFRPLVEDDIWRRLAQVPLIETSHPFLRELAAAVPPNETNDALARLEPRSNPLREVAAGSNAAAFGRDLVPGGGGISFSNPHFPWHGTERLHAVHLTVPGKLDVFGATLYGVPFPMLGFTSDVAWSITYTTDKRMSLYELALDPSDPTRYRVDDDYEAMVARDVEVPTADGSVRRRFWLTRYGPVVASQQLSWTQDRAYAIADPQRENTRMADQFLAMARAANVRDFKDALDRYVGLPWSNATAADRFGETLFANISVAAHVTDEQLDRCLTTSPARALYERGETTVLDGSRSDCAWTRDEAAPQPGIIPAHLRPFTFRTDAVFNSNDSYWLASTSPDDVLSGFPRVIGDEGTARGERTRMAATLIEGRRIGSDGLGEPGITPEKWETLFFRSRNLTAEIVVDDVVADCLARPVLEREAGDVDLTPACATLARWDRTDGLQARGSVLFREFLRNLERLPRVGYVLAPRYWRTPFDPADPVGTPRGFVTSDETRQALAAAMEKLATGGIALDAPLGEVQGVTRQGRRLPLSGADYTYHMTVPVFTPGQGYTDVRTGDSYIHLVQLGGQAPRGRFMVTYSQSTNPASPHFADLTALFSEQRFADVRFGEADIEAAQVGETITFDRR